MEVHLGYNSFLFPLSHTYVHRMHHLLHFRLFVLISLLFAYSGRCKAVCTQDCTLQFHS